MLFSDANYCILNLVMHGKWQF
uniref:Uncharacterized protein n=1 Tax=Rhizophora mucronata TaxID=61149 RepID=A0A2P2LY98_RHIMU